MGSILPYIAYKLVNKSPSNYSYLRTINIVIGVINQLSYLGGLTLHDIYIYIYILEKLLNMAMKIVDLPIISMVIIQLIIDMLVGGLEPCNFITFHSVGKCHHPN